MKLIDSKALIPAYLNKSQNKFLAEILSIILAVGLMSVLAQISLPLPWTPVPITGQTFGVTLVALCWGRMRGITATSIYLVIGALGFPVFALAKSGLSLGPTFGYLVGMWISSYAVGYLADKGFTNSFVKSLMATFVGSFFVYAFGLFVLSLFVPREHLLNAGFYPFIIGDTLKNIFAASMAWKLKDTWQK